MSASFGFLALLFASSPTGLPEEGLVRLRQKVWNELLSRTPASSNLQHARAVEQIMRSLAAMLGRNADAWGLAGLAHDLDINETKSDMSRHGVAGARLLAGMGAPEDVVHAVRSHDDRAGSPRTSILDKALYCADQGYWFALESRRGKPSAERRERLTGECGSLGLSLEKLVGICERSIKTVATPALTPAVAGPYRVRGATLLDAQDRPYLIRGTEFPAITTNQSDIFGDETQFGPFSPSSFVTVRHRANMNAARFPVDAAEYSANALYRRRVKDIVRAANRFELLAILASDGPDAFWDQIAGDFRDSANVLFAAPSRAMPTLRHAGIRQPVIVPSDERIDDPQVIYEVTPAYAALRSGDRPWRRLAGHAPVLVNDLDPKFDQASTDCAAFPADPGAAAALLEELLTEFDERAISWTLSSFLPGKLISEYRFYHWSKLDDGWLCGDPPHSAGIAMPLLSHLWGTDPHEIFAVAQQRGGFVIARGAVGAVYGRILADREMTATTSPLPTRLGNISIRIRDSRGVSRLAPLFATGAGWSFATFLVPSATATGPAQVAVVRTDGTESIANVMVADVSPALWTATHDGRGPLIAHVPGAGPAWTCSATGCRTTPIDIIGSTRLRLEGTGFRYAADRRAISVFVDNLMAPVVSFGPTETAGRDYLLIELPPELRGRGETDLFVKVAGEISNVVRIHCGEQR